ncbi:MAG: alanine--tRNA ligase [Minisyncoccia bacterium]|jgi:alanyl-tRNA synthetase
MTSSEIRQKFLKFFEKKGHTIIPSASLIPENDPTVLFTTAGMHPLVPFLLGEVHPGGKRVASVQRCIRTGDIDEVGDEVHLTFFEMLGNWSFGDYWKEDAIKWSFEFLTKELKLPISKLAISCFAGDKDAPRDDESAKIWESLGITKERIYFLSKKDNWWGPAGETGPCGPDTEMFYWTGDGEPELLTTGDNKEKWVEIWNDVFMQYNKRAPGAFEPLKQKNVDTGMGLERTVAVLNGCDVYQIDIFKPIIEEIEKLSGKKYDFKKGALGYEEMPECWALDMRSMRIIADHIRAATFILGDERGVLPSNVGQGYVLRRLIRRAARYGKVLGIKVSPFSTEIASKVIKIYPELKKNQAQILAGLAEEEKKFAVALEKGLREFERFTKVDGKIAFDLYQSFGFPIELTEELSRERGFKIDKKVFEEEFRKHQELSRTASAGQFKGGLADSSEQVVKLHTATHLLHQALIDVLGGTVDQKGSNITAERLRFDFVCPRKMTPEEVKKTEEIVNKKIKEDLPVHFELLAVHEAKAKGAIGVFDDKYAQIGGKVKVYFVGNYSKEICGGPHVAHTGEIGKFKITKEEPVAAGIRRIRATIG